MFSKNGRFSVGFEHFGLWHFATIAVCILLILGVYFLRNYFLDKRRDRIFRISVAVLMMLLEIGFFIWTIAVNGFMVDGKINHDLIPLHLCSAVMWLTAYALLKDRQDIIKIITPAAFIGALLSFFFADMGGNYIFPHFRFIHFFGLHTLFLIGCLYYFFTNKITRYTYKENIKGFIFFVGYALIVMIFNYIFDYNFLFLRKLPEAASFFESLFKAPFYIFPLMVIIFGLYQLIYVILKKR